MTVLYNMVFKEVISCEDGQRNSLALVTAGSWLCRFNAFSVILLLSFSLNGAKVWDVRSGLLRLVLNVGLSGVLLVGEQSHGCVW